MLMGYILGLWREGVGWGSQEIQGLFCIQAWLLALSLHFLGFGLGFGLGSAELGHMDGLSNGTQHCTVPPSGWRALVSVPPSHPPQGLKLVLAVGFKLLFPSSSASGHLAPDAQSLGPIGALAATGTTVFDAEVAGPPGPLHALAPWAFHLYFVFLFGHL